jgi:hypothetical protein
VTRAEHTHSRPEIKSVADGCSPVPLCAANVLEGVCCLGLLPLDHGLVARLALLLVQAPPKEPELDLIHIARAALLDSTVLGCSLEHLLHKLVVQAGGAKAVGPPFWV